jgi:cytochrome c biogenesis protein CcdA
VVLWRHRNSLSQRQLPQPDPQGKSSWLLGASITAVELPTAFPYFAAIAAIVGSGTDPGTQFALLVLFNVCFVLPLIAIVVTLWIAGDDADEVLARFREFLQRNWPVLLAGAALLAGAFVITLGATAFVAKTHGRLGKFARHLRHLMHIHA